MIRKIRLFIAQCMRCKPQFEVNDQVHVYFKVHNCERVLVKCRVREAMHWYGKAAYNVVALEEKGHVWYGMKEIVLQNQIFGAYKWAR